MEFTEETLKRIVCMGVSGYPLSRVALELNTTPDEMRKERKVNERLNEALNRYEFNAETYFTGNMMQSIISNDKGFFAETYVKVYSYLREKTGTF